MHMYMYNFYVFFMGSGRRRRKIATKIETVIGQKYSVCIHHI